MIHVGELLIFCGEIKDQLYAFLRLSNPNISQWMHAMNISNVKGIHAYYANRILNITRNINVTAIVWQDVWDEKVQVRFIFILL